MQTETINKETTKQSYQATAQAYANNVASLAPISSIEKFSKMLTSNAKIIDIGCGSGRDAKHFNDLEVDVVGIDFCSNLLDIAKKQAPLSEFQLMDIESIQFPNSTFDGAWAACSLGHISKNALPDVLKKIHLLLKEGGYFYLALKEGKGEILEKDERYDGNVKKFWSYFEAEELKNFLQAAHFKVLECDLIEKSHSYQNHLAFRVFCQKA